ncbi:hypothetical protein EYF80_012867 [Liparis tanakae]|uniref:Uncharacterized protein n=1 Tax=Liparis tanakae TaxID=230148 RepID=A0A4Z2IH79_9TELE|nr:hypothetical protein EYF80_012867 [Liparis tanakae]
MNAELGMHCSPSAGDSTDMRASEAQRRVEGGSCTPPRADKTTAFDPASSTSELGKQQQMDINKMDVNMIPTAQERHVCGPTETKPNKPKQSVL